jgi:hypothetical protein
MPYESDDLLIVDIDPAAGRDAPGGEHDLWLSMKSAHNRYRDASASLDALTAMSPAGLDSAERNLQIEAEAAEQRTAFEDYIEARLQLSEFMISKMSPQPTDAPEPRKGDQPQGSGSRGGPQVSRIAILAVVAAFLFPTAFGLGFLAHERRRTRDLEAARDEATAELNQIQQEIQGLTSRMEALKAANRSVSAAVAGMRASHVRAVKIPARMPARAPVRTPVPSGGRVARNHQELVELEKRGERTYREFTLTPSKQSERFGPVGLKVLRVDPQRKSFELSIAVDNLAPNKKRVNLYESVWIDLRGRPKAVEVVVNRIDRDRVQGYVSEPKYPRMTWLRASP